MSWLEVYKHNKFQFTSLVVPKGWENLFQYILENYQDKIQILDNFINDCIKKEMTLYPFPADLFTAFHLCPMDKIKVVIIGQDPYINEGQAMGLSFSVRNNITIPPSLNNIYENLYRHGHISTIPSHGDLTAWAEQGCLMLNAALTVTAGVSDSHKVPWVYITNAMLQYISDVTVGVCFMLWGNNALYKLNYIDTTKHYVTISSHPSPNSFKSTLRGYPSFYDSNHFKNVNDYLIKIDRTPIDWNIY